MSWSAAPGGSTRATRGSRRGAPARGRAAGSSSPERAVSVVHELRVEPLTEEAFAPFGQVISAKARTPDFKTDSGTEGWAVDFRSGRPLVMLLRTVYQGLRFTKLERHLNVT